MMKEIEITIPQYLNLKHYKATNRLTSLDDTQQMVNVISAITSYEAPDIMKWSIPSVIHVYNAIQTLFKDINPEFYPVIEWEDKLWGFSNMSKMKLGEYIDLDTLIKDPDKNINQILALLYRPVTKNNLTTATFLTKSTLKALRYEVENVFDYYELEEYDPVSRKQRAETFDNFPIEIAMGAMAFFLDTATVLLSDSQLYSLKTQEDMVKIQLTRMSKRKQQLLNITAGFTHSRKLANLKFYPSQEINQ